MARIKYVINERRLAFEGALKVHEETRLGGLAEKMRRRQFAEQAKEKKDKALRKAKAAEEAAAEEERRKLAEGPKAADLAAAGLLDTLGVPPTASSQSSPPEPSPRESTPSQSEKKSP